jgi:hypothetical protein
MLDISGVGVALDPEDEAVLLPVEADEAAAEPAVLVEAFACTVEPASRGPPGPDVKPVPPARTRDRL